MSISIENALLELNISESGCRVYRELLEHGALPARTLAERLGLPRPSVYDYLKELSVLGLVVEIGETKVKKFACDSSRRLVALLQEKADTVQAQVRELRGVTAKLGQALDEVEPQVRFYRGRDGVRNVLRELTWYENIETLTMWPIRDMVELVGREYLEELNRKRIRRGISIRGIWPKGQIVDLEQNQFLGVGPKHLRTMHVGLPGMNWPMSYWLFVDKVAFISSKREGFSMLVTSQDFAELMRVQFEALWKITKPFVPPKYQDDFLLTV